MKKILSVLLICSLLIFSLPLVAIANNSSAKEEFKKYYLNHMKDNLKKSVEAQNFSQVDLRIDGNFKATINNGLTVTNFPVNGSISIIADEFAAKMSFDGICGNENVKGNIYLVEDGMIFDDQLVELLYKYSDEEPLPENIDYIKYKFPVKGLMEEYKNATTSTIELQQTAMEMVSLAIDILPESCFYQEGEYRVLTFDMSLLSSIQLCNNIKQNKEKIAELFCEISQISPEEKEDVKKQIMDDISNLSPLNLEEIKEIPISFPDSYIKVSEHEYLANINTNITDPSIETAFMHIDIKSLNNNGISEEIMNFGLQFKDPEIDMDITCSLNGNSSLISSKAVFDLQGAISDQQDRFEIILKSEMITNQNKNHIEIPQLNDQNSIIIYDEEIQQV